MYYYCQLPSLNRGEFQELDEELKRRNIKVEIKELVTGGRIYRIREEELYLLPTDEKGPYLGDDNSGHSIYRMPEYDHEKWEQLKDNSAENKRQNKKCPGL